MADKYRPLFFAKNVKRMRQHRSDFGANQIYNPYYIVSVRVKQVEKLIKNFFKPKKTERLPVNHLHLSGVKWRYPL
jgi:hypothetical protein